MKTTNKLKYLLIGFFLMNFTQAQNNIELSLQAAMDYAVENNKMMQNASLSIQESQAALRSSIAQGLPQVEANFDYQNFFGTMIYLGPMAFEFTPTSNLNVSVGQLIFSGSYIVGIQMAVLYREITKLNYQKTEADIRAQVMNSYSLVLISQRSIEIIEQNVKNMEDVIAKTDALVIVGILDKTDLDQIKLQKLMLENELRSARRQLELAKNLMRLTLGITPQTEIILTDDLFALLTNANIDRTLNTPYDAKANLDFQLMMLQRDLAKKRLNMEKTKFLPTITGFYNHIEKIKRPELDFSPNQIIGLNVSFPIFTSGVRYFSHAQAKIQYLSAQNQMDFVADQLSIQENQLRLNLKTAKEQFEAQQENIVLARRVYDNIYLKYQQGVVSGLDMTTANSNLLQAENFYNLSIMQLLDSKTALDKFLNQMNIR